MISKETRFSIIEELRIHHHLPWLLKIAQVSRSGYYKWRIASLKAKVALKEELDLKEHIMAIHRAHPYYGYLRITVVLRREGLLVNHKRVYRLMKELGIKSVIRKKRRFFGREASVVNPNRLERNFCADAPFQKLVTDITYLRVGEQFYYLSAIQDLFNNEIVAWNISDRNDLALVMNTLDKLQSQVNLKGATLHSDQGFQYTSKAYNKYLQDSGILGSHSRRGNCYDNACIESFFSHLKVEKLYIEKPTTIEELQGTIEGYISFYNYERYQKKLGGRSPVEYRKTAA